MLKRIVAVTAILFLFGCAWTTGERITLIEPGMTQKEVVTIIGKPDGFRQKNGYTIYKYTNRLISGWANDKTDYSLIFQDNKLIEYGAGEVRERNNGGVYSLFVYQM